jgi:glutaredoxin
MIRRIRNKFPQFKEPSHNVTGTDFHSLCITAKHHVECVTCMGGLSLLHKRAVRMAQGCPYCTRGHCIWHRAVLIAKEGSAYGTGLSLLHKRAVHMAQGCPYCKRGQCIWHRTVSMAQEDIPMTQKASPWQRRAVPMAQEISLHGTGGLSP